MLTKAGIDRFNELVTDLRRDLSGTFAAQDGIIYWYGDVLKELGELFGYMLIGDSNKKGGDKNAIDRR